MAVRTVFLGLVGLAAVGLIGLGVAFQLMPEAALDAVDHRIESLPLVMGGRYFVMGALMLGALFYPDKRVLAALLLGYAALGAIDAVIYWSHEPAPHLRAGVLSLIGAVYFWRVSSSQT